MPSPPGPHSRPGTRRGAPRRALHLVLAMLLALGSMIATQRPAAAEPEGFLTITKGVQGWTDGQVVEPGDTFTYTILITCSNTSTDAGCTNAQLSDPLPEGISLNDGPEDIAITPSGAGEASADGNDITVDFEQPLVDPAGGQGIQAGTTIEISIPVQVDEDISAELNGQDLTNTATVDGSNTDPATDDFTVVPNVPVELAASTDKSFDPDSAIASPGTGTTMTLTGGNDSNVPVDEIVMTDPTDPPGAFDSLALTGDLDVTLPEGAEQVQVDCYVGGTWVDGAPAATAALPAGGGSRRL